MSAKKFIFLFLAFVGVSVLAYSIYKHPFDYIFWGVLALIHVVYYLRNLDIFRRDFRAWRDEVWNGDETAKRREREIDAMLMQMRSGSSDASTPS